MSEPTGKRAAVYVRVSSAGQAEDGTSLQSQEERCRAYCGQRGYTVAGIYREVHTGTELWERPELTRLREAVRRREVNLVVVYAIDRLSRDPVHLGVLLSEADHAGVSVEFVTEPLDDSPEGQLIRFVRGYAAKVEHEKFKERSLRGKRLRVKDGKPLHGPRPLYGTTWNADKTAYLLSEPEAGIVRRIWREARTGKPLRHIGRDLEADGIPTPSGKGSRWNASTIAGILADSRYAGQGSAYRWHVEKVNGHRRVTERPPDEQVALPPTAFPAIVTLEDLAAVRAILAQNKARSARRNQHPEDYLLRGGVAVCGLCGSPMHAHRTTSTPEAVKAYICGQRKMHRESCPDGAWIRADELDAAVWQGVRERLLNPEIIVQELAHLRREDPTEADLAALDRSLTTVAKRQSRLARAVATLDDEDAAEPLLREMTALADQKKRLEAEREVVLTRHRAWETTQERLGALEHWCDLVSVRLDEQTYGEKRETLEMLDLRVKVYPRGHEPRWLITASIPLGDDIVSDTRTGTGARRWPGAGASTRSCRAAAS